MEQSNAVNVFNVTNIGLLNIIWFCISSFCVTISLITITTSSEYSFYCHLQKWLTVLGVYTLLYIMIRCLYRGFNYQTTFRSLCLGLVFGIGVYGACFWGDSCKVMGWYLCVLSTFHFSEFITISWCNRKSLSVSSFILNHSPEYWIALLTSWVEFGIEAYFFPGLKSYTYISCFGLFLCFLGEFLRKTAMFTASTNFNHLVQLEKEEGHRLVTHGIYSLCRHPSYLGWFIWSIGTQLLLLNPFCTVAYTFVSWNFFNKRIITEELYLISFFKEDYLTYQKKVGTGLPFIQGFILDSYKST